MAETNTPYKWQKISPIEDILAPRNTVLENSKQLE